MGQGNYGTVRFSPNMTASMTRMYQSTLTHTASPRNLSWAINLERGSSVSDSLDDNQAHHSQVHYCTIGAMDANHPLLRKVLYAIQLYRAFSFPFGTGPLSGSALAAPDMSGKVRALILAFPGLP